jgi:beta-lactam-binding protein with PASTA domain
VSKPSWLTVAVAGAGGFLAGVLLIAILGGPKGVTHTTTKTATETVTRTVDGRDTVPDVVGQRLPEAKDRLSSFHVEVDANTIFGVVDEDNWVVVDQDPGEGARVAPGATVTLSVERR